MCQDQTKYTGIVRNSKSIVFYYDELPHYEYKICLVLGKNNWNDGNFEKSSFARVFLVRNILDNKIKH